MWNPKIRESDWLRQVLREVLGESTRESLADLKINSDSEILNPKRGMLCKLGNEKKAKRLQTIHFTALLKLNNSFEKCSLLEDYIAVHQENLH